MALRRALLLGVALGLSSAAHARAAMPLTMTAGLVAPAPDGFVGMCAESPQLCTSQQSNAPGAVPSDKVLMKMVKHINRRVNRYVRWQADIGERWSLPVGDKHAVGDCEDYAIEKRVQLIAAGFPARDLHFAVGYLPNVGLHTVLVAEIGGRDIVLDSRTSWTMPWFDTPYVWVLRQSQQDPTVWQSTIALSHTETSKAI